MKVPVHMFAFADEGDRNTVRYVDVPQDYVEGTNPHDFLELVFKFGQNDFQPQNIYSVSVGDVVQLGDKYFIVMGAGFKEISKEEFDGLVPPTAHNSILFL